MKFKSLFTALLLSVFLVGPAFAMPVVWDLGGVGITGYNIGTGDSDNKTGQLTEMGFYAETTVTQYDTDGNFVLSVGDQFKDNGSLFGNGLVPVGTDTEGLGFLWEMTGAMSNFAGYVSAVTNPAPGNSDTKIEFTYTSGTLTLYADDDMNARHITRVNSDDVGFNDGTPIAIFNLIYGKGYTFLDFGGGDVENQGSGEFQLQATFLADNFWFDALGNDLADTYNNIVSPINWFIQFVDYNVDEPEFTGVGAVDNEGKFVLFNVNVTHDGSMEFGAVPEPATMVLFGIGLLSLAGVTRRKIS